MNHKDVYGCTALHRAAEHSKFHKSMNLNIGVQVNISGIFFSSDNVKIAELLVENGADMNIKDSYNDTALRWAQIHSI